MNPPSLSIISPIYNCAEFFYSSYVSISNQSFCDWEWIIVDDGSTDNLSALVCEVNDKRIKYFTLPRNMGRGYARNYALMNVSSSICVNWDVDDTYPIDRLHKIVEAFSSGIDYCYEPVNIVDSDGNVLRQLSSAGGPFFSFPIHNSLSFKTDVGLKYLYQMIGTTGGIGEDHYLVLALSAFHKGIALDFHSNYFQSREVYSLKTLHSHLGALLAYLRCLCNSKYPFWHKILLSLFKIPKSVASIFLQSSYLLFGKY
jgi:glycosyltransferase involved in cell wall biosynthesis